MREVQINGLIGGSCGKYVLGIRQDFGLLIGWGWISGKIPLIIQYFQSKKLVHWEGGSLERRCFEMESWVEKEYVWVGKVTCWNSIIFWLKPTLIETIKTLGFGRWMFPEISRLIRPTKKFIWAWWDHKFQIWWRIFGG